MEVDEDDDFYAPEESVKEGAEPQQKTEEAAESKKLQNRTLKQIKKTRT
jgi:hypothetical protein